MLGDRRTTASLSTPALLCELSSRLDDVPGYEFLVVGCRSSFDVTSVSHHNCSYRIVDVLAYKEDTGDSALFTVVLAHQQTYASRKPGCISTYYFDIVDTELTHFLIEFADIPASWTEPLRISISQRIPI